MRGRKGHESHGATSEEGEKTRRGRGGDTQGANAMNARERSGGVQVTSEQPSPRVLGDGGWCESRASGTTSGEFACRQLCLHAQ